MLELALSRPLEIEVGHYVALWRCKENGQSRPSLDLLRPEQPQSGLCRVWAASMLPKPGNVAKTQEKAVTRADAQSHGDALAVETNGAAGFAVVIGPTRAQVRAQWQRRLLEAASIRSMLQPARPKHNEIKREEKKEGKEGEGKEKGAEAGERTEEQQQRVAQEHDVGAADKDDGSADAADHDVVAVDARLRSHVWRRLNAGAEPPPVAKVVPADVVQIPIGMAGNLTQAQVDMRDGAVAAWIQTANERRRAERRVPKVGERAAVIVDSASFLAFEMRRTAKTAAP